MWQIFGDIFTHLNVDSIRTVRMVCKTWKDLVYYSCPKIQFACHLTDETQKFAVQSEEIISCLDIHDFSGKKNEVISSTSGIGLLFGSAERIQFTSKAIPADEIPKMMRFAVDSVKKLAFQDCRINTLRPFLETKQSFSYLRELSVSIVFTCSFKSKVINSYFIYHFRLDTRRVRDVMISKYWKLCRRLTTQ